MKLKDANKSIEQLAAEVIETRNVRLFRNSRFGIGIEWDDQKYNSGIREFEPDHIIINEINRIDIDVHRGARAEKIIYFVKIFKAYQESDEWKTFKITDTAEQAFAIKDILEDMISAFRVETDKPPTIIKISKIPDEISLETFVQMAAYLAGIQLQDEDVCDYKKIMVSQEVMGELTASYKKYWKRCSPQLSDDVILRRSQIYLDCIKVDQDLEPGTVAVHEGFIIHH